MAPAADELAELEEEADAEEGEETTPTPPLMVRNGVPGASRVGFWWTYAASNAPGLER